MNSSIFEKEDTGSVTLFSMYLNTANDGIRYMSIIMSANINMDVVISVEVKGRYCSTALTKMVSDEIKTPIIMMNNIVNVNMFIILLTTLSVFGSVILFVVGLFK